MKAVFVWNRSVLLTAIAIAVGGSICPASFAGAIAIASNNFRTNAGGLPVARDRTFGASSSPLFAATKSAVLEKPAVEIIVLHGEGRRFARWGRGVRRPDVDEVVRASWGKPSSAATKGLDAEEMVLFNLARRRGFLEITAGGTFERRGAARLPSTYRSLCDARGQPSIVLRKGRGGGGGASENNNNKADEVVCDLSPLRDPAKFDEVARLCLNAKEGGETSVLFRGGNGGGGERGDLDGGYGDELKNPWRTRPIHRLPPRCVWWTGLEPGEAKKLVKSLSRVFGTEEKMPRRRRENSSASGARIGGRAHRLN